MSSLPVYGLCSLVTASVVVLLAMSTDFFVSYIDEIITPCQHDSVYRNGECICDNTNGVFSGKYCETCQCQHLGICSIQENSTSRWGCRCPSHQKWTGTLCDKCYATQKEGENCRGECLELPGVFKHYGPKCNTVCMASSSSSAGRCIEVRAGGGTCNACNGHGSCTSTGECECDDGYFTSRSGEQCVLQCSDAGITCPEGQGTCQSIGGQLQCVCEENWYGQNCDQSCLEDDGNGLPCSGHGTCGYDQTESLTCSCTTHWIGDFCEQRCPGDASYPSSCSGHGTCRSNGNKATCDCVEGWHGEDCSCSPIYTCSGHGTCKDDASCECFDYQRGSTEVHFAGAYCERCKDNWFGSACHLYCDSASLYDSNPDKNGIHIGCNGHGACQLETQFETEHVTCICDGTNPDTFCATCLPDYYPSWDIANVSVAHCSVPCEPGTCSNRGICNPQYNGYNDLCICDKYKMPGTEIELDTLDPKQNCAVCKENWYPTSMTSPDRCTKYCAADGKVENGHIVFDVSATERNYDLLGDKEAQKICTSSDQHFGPDADCNVCSAQGACYADGTCKCDDGTTGEYCNIQCTSPDGLRCSDHGRCVRNELEMWFNPNTENFRCECLPFDPYTSETRQRLIKQNFKVSPPPSPHYYGQFCEFHCPRYNEEICADRGECSTGVAVDEMGYPRQCNKDLDCADIDGAFCATQSSPWDSLMDNGRSFFSSGPDSPGYFTCATSQQCLDDIYSIKWDEFCVNMLHGWYPPVLNTATCAYEPTNTCRASIEEFFMNDFKDGKTWCEAALADLMPSVDSSCSKDSYADQIEFLNERVPVCLEYTLENTCNSQSNCIYDQTLAHIQSVDQECAGQTPPCSGPCQSTGNQTCETKTYCRAKTCPDVIFENSIESLCVIEPPCESNENWADFCADISGNMRSIRLASNITDMSSADLFYTCHMFRNRVHPNKMEKKIPGAMQLNGVLRIFGEDVSVESLRTSVIDSIIETESSCISEDFSNTTFCQSHLDAIVPSWYAPVTPRSNWFSPWLVACPQGPDSLWSSEAEASMRIQEVSLECAAFHKSPGILGEDWEEATDEKDTISYTSVKKWSLECPGRSTKYFDDVEFVSEGLVASAESCLTANGWSNCNVEDAVIASSLWPTNPIGCQLRPNQLMLRWGETGWSPATVQTEFTERCLEGLSAPWVPRTVQLPTLCDLGACHPEDDCLLCSDPEASCDLTASVQCTAPTRINFRDTNRCGRGGSAWQPFSVPSTTYFCDWVQPSMVSVETLGQIFNGSLSSRGILTIYSMANISRPETIEMKIGNVTKNISSLRVIGTDVSLIWSNDRDVPQQESELAISELEQCNDDFNWFSYCSQQDLGTLLDTQGHPGLTNGWSGNSYLMSKSVLKFGTIQRQDLQFGEHEIEIRMVDSSDRVRVSCGNMIAEDQGSVYLSGNFSKCELKSIYGFSSVSSILLDGVEQILDFDDVEAQYSDRSFFKLDVSKNKTSNSDWSFEENNVIRKQSFEYDNTGVRFNLPSMHHDSIRVSGWSYIQDDDGELATMRLTNEHGNEIAQIYVWAKSLYIKTGTLTEHHGQRISSIPVNKWWFWSIEATHTSETRFQAENHTVFANNQTYYVQNWNISVRVDVPEPVSWYGTRQVETHPRLRKHYRKASQSFESLRGVSADRCGHACLHHSECQQWSHSKSDSICYLHATACHKDPNCVNGRHTLMSISSGSLASHLEIFAGEPKTSLIGGSRWRNIRADPIIESPFCEPIPFESIHERWREPLRAMVVPFEPDATTICNAIVDAWSLMPEYESKVCYGQDCIYNSKDISACGIHLDTLVPDVSDGCDQVKFSETNWTAYCHYMKSFDPIQTGNDNRVPFLGGMDVDLPNICQVPWAEYDDAESTCGTIETDWFKQCLERTSVYENYCSVECLEDIDERLSSSPGSKGICQIRDEYLAAEIAPETCDCPLGDLVITDFCLMQDAYHEGQNILIPELYHSECSTIPACTETLKNSLNRSDWLHWCSDLSRGEVVGTCSRTTCDCDIDNIPGVSGDRCELSCPSGVSNGKELACSGPNGKCFAVDPSEIIDDSVKQQSVGESRLGTNFSGPLVPNWLRGPSPSMDGRCQCSLGSGQACSIPCDRCNNGTYGYEMASQYGICDSFNGICRALPAFMRYNTKIEDLKVSYNTTTFESSLGIYRWKYPERFLFESDETLLYESLYYESTVAMTSSYIASPIETNDPIIQRSIDTVLRVFEDYCWVDLPDEYLNNEQQVTFKGTAITPDAPSLQLALVPPPSWGQCKKIVMDESFYFCFSKGKMYALENGNPILIRSFGDENVPKEKMSFVKRNSDTLYAYGGEYVYEKTTFVSDSVYKIRFERRAWSPYNIIFMQWYEVEPEGIVKPAPQSWPVMYSFYDRLILLETIEQTHRLMSMKYQTLTTNARWSVLSEWQTSSNAIAMQGNRSTDTVHIYFDDMSVYTFFNNTLQNDTLNKTEFEYKLEGAGYCGNGAKSLPGGGFPARLSPGDPLYSADGAQECMNRCLAANPNYRAFYTRHDGNYDDQCKCAMSCDPLVTSGNAKDIYKGYRIREKTFTLPEPVSTLSPGWTAAAGLLMPCKLEMVNNSIQIGGLTVARYDVPATEVKLYLDEWRTIDVQSKANTVLRFQNAISWETQSRPSLAKLFEDTSFSQKWSALNHISRLYMHQARWSLHKDMLIKWSLSRQMPESIVEFTPMSVSPSDDFLNFFSTLEPSILEETPATIPNELHITWEGETFERSLAIYGLYSESLTDYSQRIDFSRDELLVYVTWTPLSLNVRISRSNGDGYAEWSIVNPVRTFLVVLHLEEWIYDKTSPFQPSDSVDGLSDGDALLQMFVSTEKMQTYNMLSQTNTFLQYTASHCSLTSDEQCPGLLPFVNLPCSGRGRCSISCQCTCEVAKSVLESSSSALVTTDWLKSPYRGAGCEITCPGYDGYDLSSICNSRGICQRDGKCTCSQGYTGEACQFLCPVNSKNETCSLHGGCGTEAIDTDSFSFTKDVYGDMLSARNKKHFGNALAQFYDKCLYDNFIEQKSTFGVYSSDGSYFDTLRASMLACDSHNKQLTIDMSKKNNRIYPVGRCIGIRQLSQQNYSTVQLQPIELKSLTPITEFDCEPSECSIQVVEDDDQTLVGVTFELNSDVFSFELEYIHGSSIGRRSYDINGKIWNLDVDWTPNKCHIILETQDQKIKHVLLNLDESIEYVTIEIFPGKNFIRAYPVHLPKNPSSQITWLAPLYEQKYMRMTKILTGKYFNAPSEDTSLERYLFNKAEAEMECDLYVECEGIVQWNQLYEGTLYSLYTTRTIIEGHTLKDFSNFDFSFFQKMTNIYKGKLLEDSVCDVLVPGLSRYPTVEYIEEYNVPIQDADLTIVEDRETGAVEIGNGIWTKCWTYMPNLNTKVGCFEEAKKSNYGFAFSEVTNTCLIYTGITDASKIQLDKYTDETRLSQHDPCTRDASWFT